MHRARRKAGRAPARIHACVRQEPPAADRRVEPYHPSDVADRTRPMQRPGAKQRTWDRHVASHLRRRPPPSSVCCPLECDVLTTGWCTTREATCTGWQRWRFGVCDLPRCDTDALDVRTRRATRTFDVLPGSVTWCRMRDRPHRQGRAGCRPGCRVRCRWRRSRQPRQDGCPSVARDLPARRAGRRAGRWWRRAP